MKKQDDYLTVGEKKQLIGSVAKRGEDLRYGVISAFGNKLAEGEVSHLQRANVGVRRRDGFIRLGKQIQGLVYLSSISTTISYLKRLRLQPGEHVSQAGKLPIEASM